MKKTLLLAAITAVLCINLSAGNLSLSSYVLIDSYPEYSAMGDSVAAGNFGITAASANPASISGAKNFEFAVMHNMWYRDVRNQKIDVVKNFEFGNIMAGISYVNLGTINSLGIDSNDAPIITNETLNLYALTGSLAYGKTIRDFSIGLGAKLITENLGAGNSYNFCFDAGFIYEDVLVDNLDFGASLLNISTEREGYNLPLNLKGALVYHMIYGGEEIMKVGVSGDYLINEEDIKLEAGFEYTLFSSLFLRGGLNLGNNDKLNFSAGAGFYIEGITFDYSYIPNPDLGDVHKISISGRVAAPEKTENGTELKEGETFESYLKSGDYYYNNKQYRRALKYYEYMNLIYWKDIEDLADAEKSRFYQKMGIAYYNLKDNRRAKQNFERAQYYDKDNEVLKHWIRSIK